MFIRTLNAHEAVLTVECEVRRVLVVVVDQRSDIVWPRHHLAVWLTRTTTGWDENKLNIKHRAHNTPHTSLHHLFLEIRKTKPNSGQVLVPPVTKPPSQALIWMNLIPSQYKSGCSRVGGRLSYKAVIIVNPPDLLVSVRLVGERGPSQTWLGWWILWALTGDWGVSQSVSALLHQGGRWAVQWGRLYTSTTSTTSTSSTSSSTSSDNILLKIDSVRAWPTIK